MKLLITSALAATVASTAIAGNSDRYNDIRFDSAVGHISSFDTFKNVKSDPAPLPQVRFSTRSGTNQQSSAGSYAYTNPYGVGPNNDSR